MINSDSCTHNGLLVILRVVILVIGLSYKKRPLCVLKTYSQNITFLYICRSFLVGTTFTQEIGQIKQHYWLL